jgi:acetate kinase
VGASAQESTRVSSVILVVNAGSSSIKFALYPPTPGIPGDALLRGEVSGIGHAPRFAVRGQQLKPVDEALASGAGNFGHRDALAHMMAWLNHAAGQYRIMAAGHRVVHGGENYAQPVIIDDSVLRTLEALIPLARTHEPHEIAAIHAVAGAWPGLRQVACFDTAFHRTQPEVAQLYGLPKELAAAGVRRYGFHGLSYQYIAQALPEHAGPRADGRVIVAHLGSGASLCAMIGRRSMATTMGFSTLDGLLMATRSGALDPGVVLYLIEERNMSAHEVSDLLYNRSGLLGVSGVSGDMRALLASADPHARQAVDLFVYYVAREAGALAAALEGLDALVFTGGIGEHAAEIRARICGACRWLGIELDAEANRLHASCISTAGSRASAWMIPTDEELVIAQETSRMLAA